MSAREHWENVYRAKRPEEVSWFHPHLETSLSLIHRYAPGPSSRIIDAGCGQSTLAGDLLALGYCHLTALDISPSAIDFVKAQLGVSGDKVEWIVADITRASLPPGAYDLWHDRAVFHFLTGAPDRAAYVERVRTSVKPGGHIIIGGFGPEGPTRCSGLEVQRHSADSLCAEFGSDFRLIESTMALHRTPSGSTQQFLYCLFSLG